MRSISPYDAKKREIKESIIEEIVESISSIGIIGVDEKSILREPAHIALAKEAIRTRKKAYDRAFEELYQEFEIQEAVAEINEEQKIIKG